ncbi:MAG: SusC/RagA family TonB-linked outer membrane protein [Parabacteroides sp.]
MKVRQNLLGMILLLFCSISVFAQHAVKGKVTDAKTGDALVGVNVMLKGSTGSGTTTDMDGNYSLSVPSSSTLVFSYIGYLSQDVRVGNQSVVNVSLQEDVESLDEVVVVGYGTMRKRDLTGSVSQVKAEKMAEFTVSNPVQALQGRVPGVVITSNTGSPDGNFTIRVRGTNSIQGGNDPLYIVDGMPANVSSINSQDIASVEVLKDASATAIYGSRGANGVILITTKRGKTGATSVSYDGSIGFQQLIKKMDMLNGSEWAQIVNLQQTNDVGKPYFTDAEVAAFGAGVTDWQDEVYSTTPVQNHNLTISGGTEKTQVLVSGSLMLRDGIIKPSNYNKYNLRGTINHQINDHFDVDLIMAYARTTKQTRNNSGGNRGNSIIGAAISAPPVLSPYNEDGSYNNLMTAYPFMSNALCNPVNRINEASNSVRANLINTNAALTYKPIKGLSLKASIGVENLDYRTDSYTTAKILNGTNSASVSQNTQTTIINENIANYNTTIAKDHRLDFTAGFTYQQYEGRSMSMSGSGFLSDAPETDQISAAESFGTPSTGYSKWVLMSYLARANYSYKGKYMATVSFRADGSSRYSEGNKWGYFPSAALAWRVSDEGFMKDIEQISDLKLRAGYGETGSTAIGAYATLNMLSQGKAPIDGTVATYYAASTTLPSDLKWETTAQWNVGIDLAMFDSRLRVTADFYNKNTRDLLNSVALPASTGYNNTIRNIGKMNNKGFELLVEGDLIRSKNFDWTASLNFALNRNKVVKLYDGKDVYGSRVGLAYIEDFINLVREGEPLGVFYVYEEDGYDEKGNLKYVDRDGNGVLNNDDKFIAGDPNPDFTYGITSDMRFKNFEFSFFLQGSQGNDVFNVAETANLDLGMGLNVRKEVLYDHWTPENPTAKYPNITRKLDLRYSDRYVENGSYLRLKNIQLAYNLPVAAWGAGSWLKGVKLYVSAQNLLTITGYSGRDPEVSSWGGGVNAGLDYLTYPNVKTYTVGAKVQF